MPDRRFALAALGSALALPALAQQQHHAGHDPLYAHLRDPNATDLPAAAESQRFAYSPAPAAASPGRWAPRAVLPLPRSEMAWATAEGDRMHLVGGYGQQRVDRPYHHVYEPGPDRWRDAAPIPRGANHVGVAAADGTVYAVGGFVEQNRVPHAEVFAYAAAEDRWRPLRPLGRPPEVPSPSSSWAAGSTPLAAATSAPSTGTRPTTWRPTAGSPAPRFPARATTRPPWSSAA